jgi:subtilisin family serine protease
VINNSWGCPLSEGCDEDGTALLEQAVDAVHAAGILVVVSAGNDGPACSSLTEAPAAFAHAFAVGATSGSQIASFSSRGPSDSGALKPEISAPGVSIRSSLPLNTYGNLQGTSMASPHVAGVAALVLSAAPALKGNPDAVIALLEQSAQPLTSTQNCGAYPGAQVPNAVFGYGLVDALSAYEQGVGPLFRDEFE